MSTEGNGKQAGGSEQGTLLKQSGPYFATVSPQGAQLVLNALAMIEVLDEPHIVAIAEITRRREDWVDYVHPAMMRRVALAVLAFSDELHQEAA